MATLTFDATVRHRGGGSVAASFQAPPGVTVLFGPSGSGKTTLLRMVAGLAPVSEGTIRLGGIAWDEGSLRLPPQKRHVGYLPQEGLLFPHLSVAANLAFGLAGRPRDVREARLRVLCDLLGIRGLEDRRPHELSGGQRQRVALGRALAGEPQVLLLDEPLSALDRPEQRRLQGELQSLLPSLGIPCLWVTHNRHEAGILGQWAVVLDGGRMLQAGPLPEALDRPRCLAAARLLGVGNLLPGRVSAGGAVMLGGRRLELGSALPEGTPVRMAFRAEDVRLHGPGHTPVQAVDDEGAFLRVRLDLGLDQPLDVRLTRGMASGLPLHPGIGLAWDLDPRRVSLLEV